MSYVERLDKLYAKLTDRASGYFAANGVPYHARETVVVEAPSHGHETTSEAASLYVYMEAMRGVITGDWTGLSSSWKVVEEFFIPGNQESYADYNPASPARYAAELDEVSQYPTELSYAVSAGPDPIAARLKAAHGDSCYSMHWLGDPDNLFGFGNLFNTFQRGTMESVWDTIPQPCVDDKSVGGPNGYLDLFVKQDGAPPAQWKYTVASDADARCIQGVFFAKYLCEKMGRPGPPADIVAKATKMGDWLLYTCYDKYFQKIQAAPSPQPAQTPEDAFHGLLSWYTAFGAPLERQGWAFRIGCSHSHSGYQNAYAAYVMHAESDGIFKEEWGKSFERQLQLYAWLQSADGAIAGGCTNSWKGRYEPYPTGLPTFYGMAYVEHPVYSNPPSNRWSGMNAWGMERVVQYYHVTRDARVRPLVHDWCMWVARRVKTRKRDGRVVIPAELQWTGTPARSWGAQDTGFPAKSASLRCKVRGWGTDLGIMACFARCLLFFSTAEGGSKSGQGAERAAKRLLEALEEYSGDFGYSTTEFRKDYAKFDQRVYVPPGFSGVTPHGEPIDSTSTFFSLRKKLYEADPMYRRVRAAVDAGKAPKIRLHRFWAQTEIAITLAVAHILLN